MSSNGDISGLNNLHRLVEHSQGIHWNGRYIWFCNGEWCVSQRNDTCSIETAWIANHWFDRPYQ